MKKMKENSKSGFSLVEIMVSILILAVLAVGGSAMMAQTGGTIQRQQNKREAIVAANTVLESYWNMTYADLEYLEDLPLSQNVTVNGQSRTVSIAISSRTNIEGNYYEIVVSVPWMAGETVELVSHRYERGLSKARIN